MKLVRIIFAALALALAGLLLLSPAGSLATPEHRVQPGDTLSELAEKYGVTVQELAEANGIVDPDRILTGEVLLIPREGRGQAVAPAGEGFAGGGVYIVQAGDTLSEIADRFGIPLVAIIAANGLANPHFIMEGGTITIPVVESALVPPYAPDIEAILEEFALAEGLDPGIVKAMAYLESGWQQHVVSPTGAVGIMQIQPSTGHWLQQDIFGYRLNIETSAYDNIKAGVRYLRILHTLTGDTDQALAAYYQGYGALSLGILYEDTVQYVADVKALRDRFWP